MLTAATLHPQRQKSPHSAGTQAQSCTGHPLLPSLHCTDVMGAELLFLLRSSIQRNRHLNYVKEEVSAKELSSSPVLWHEKQLNQTQKARFMQKLQSGNAKVKGLSLLLGHGSAYDGGHSSCTALKPEQPHPAAVL